MNPLVDFWHAMSLDEPPYIHPNDKDVLVAGELLGTHFDCTTNSFDAFIKGTRFGNFGDDRFHAALLPVPYLGSLENAQFVILMLNPGFNYVDYYAEFRVTALTNTLKKTIRQELKDEEFPFCWLNPEFCWHSGFVYWEQKLRNVLRQIARERFDGAYLVALRELSQKLATLQLVPYHSRKFKAHVLIDMLPSISKMKDYVQTLASGQLAQKTIIAMRQRSSWGLKHGSSIILYEPRHALGASLEPNSPGGKAILDHFCRKS